MHRSDSDKIKKIQARHILKRKEQMISKMKYAFKQLSRRYALPWSIRKLVIFTNYTLTKNIYICHKNFPKYIFLLIALKEAAPDVHFHYVIFFIFRILLFYIFL